MVWSIARTRTSVRIVSLVWASMPVAFSVSRSRRVRSTSTRSLGRMKPPAPVSGEISVEMARMPEGSSAAKEPGAVGLDQLGLGIGLAGDEGRARDRAGELLDPVRPVLPAHKVAAGGAGRPGLPLDVARGDHLAHVDVALRHQDFDG